MTLGNSPQPLTRRQLRELARANEPAIVDDGPAAVEAAGDPHDTTTGSHSRHTAPRADQPGEPARNEPKSDDKTSTDKTSTDKTSTDKTSTDKSSAEKPGTEKPSTEKPSTEKPGTEKPGTEQTRDSPATTAPEAGKTADKAPAAMTPAPVKPAAKKPSAGKPGAEKPGADKQGAEKQGAEKPGTTKQGAEKAGTVQPDTLKPTAVKPDAVKPGAGTPTAARQDRGAPEAARPAPAPLPMPDAAPKRTPVVIDSAVVEPGRALTRRELRALQAAASASAAPATPPSRPDVPASDAQTPAPSPAAAASTALEPTGLTPPLGHWSIDRDDDSHIETIGRRDDQTFDDLVGRGIGAGGIPTTTNALILPAIPRQGNTGPITSTGEIMITGSIDLPRSLGATGQHPNLFDSSEMDRMLDQLDEGGHHNDVAPVSASRAVSTHTSTRGVMTPPRKRGASLPTVLAITAAVLAIGVLSLFVVGYAFNIY
jgi:hypothetical protein